MLFLNQGVPLLQVQGTLISDETIYELTGRKTLPRVRVVIYDYNSWILSSDRADDSSICSATATKP